MSHGFETYTDSGHLLATVHAKSMHFVGVAAFASTPSSTVTRYTITSTSRPLVFARLLVGELVAVSAVSNGGSGNTWSIDVVGPNRNAVTLLCYGLLTNQAPADTFGMQLFGPTGEVTFDSTRKPLWLSELFTQVGAGPLTPSAMTATYAQTYTSPALTVYTVAQSTPGPGGGIYYLGIRRTLTGHVYDWCTFNSGTGSPSTAIYVNSTVFVIESAGLT